MFQLDEVMVMEKTFECHLKNLGKVFSRYKNACLKLNTKKWPLFQKEGHFLGNIKSDSCIKTDPAKTDVKN